MRIFLSGLFIFLMTLSAWADPPFVTNDPAPPDTGQWEVILPFTLTRSNDGDYEGELITCDIDYGYDKFTQLTIEVPIVYNKPGGEDLRSGIGDIALEYKRRFGINDEEGYFGLDSQINLPSGDNKRGLGSGHITAQLALLYEKKWDKTLFYSDLRYVWQTGEEGKNFWFLGGVVEQEINSHLVVGGEVFCNTSGDSEGRFNIQFNGGIKYGISQNTTFLFSIGRSFRNDPDLTVFVGLKILTP